MFLTIYECGILWPMIFIAVGAMEKSPSSATSAVCALVFAKPSFVAIRGKPDLLQYVCNMQIDEKITTAKLEKPSIEEIIGKFIVEADTKFAAWIADKAI